MTNIYFDPSGVDTSDIQDGQQIDAADVKKPLDNLVSAIETMDMNLGDAIVLEEQTSDPAAATGIVTLYVLDGTLYAKDAEGLVYNLFSVGGLTPFEQAVFNRNPLLWYSFDTDDTTAINRGSLGDTQNSSFVSVESDFQTGALGANQAWDINAGSQRIVIPNDDGLSDPSDFTIMVISRSASAGGGSGGRFFDWGDRLKAALLSDGRIGWAVDRSGANSQVYTLASYLSFPMSEFLMFFFSFSEANGPRMFVGANGSVTEPTYETSGSFAQAVGSGSIIYPASSADYFIGNKSALDRGFDGLMDEFVHFPAELTQQQMELILAATSI